MIYIYIYISYYWAALCAGSNGSPSTSSALGFLSPASRTALGPSVTKKTCPDASCGTPGATRALVAAFAFPSSALNNFLHSVAFSDCLIRPPLNAEISRSLQEIGCEDSCPQWFWNSIRDFIQHIWAFHGPHDRLVVDCISSERIHQITWGARLQAIEYCFFRAHLTQPNWIPGEYVPLVYIYICIYIYIYMYIYLIIFPRNRWSCTGCCHFQGPHRCYLIAMFTLSPTNNKCRISLIYQNVLLIYTPLLQHENH